MSVTWHCKELTGQPIDGVSIVAKVLLYSSKVSAPP